MIICSFSDFQKPLDEAPRNLKGAKLHKWILNNLKHRKRVSCWEIEENMKVCKAFMFLEQIGKIKTDNTNYGYPYVGVVVK